MRIYRKLVRDRIPDIIRQGGASCETRTLTDDEYRDALKSKLREEVSEYEESGDPLELADIFEVIRALAKLDGLTDFALEEMRARKEKERGAFLTRTYLISVSEPSEK